MLLWFDTTKVLDVSRGLNQPLHLRLVHRPDGCTSLLMQLLLPQKSTLSKSGVEKLTTVPVNGR